MLITMRPRVLHLSLMLLGMIVPVVMLMAAVPLLMPTVTTLTVIMVVPMSVKQLLRVIPMMLFASDHPRAQSC